MKAKIVKSKQVICLLCIAAVVFLAGACQEEERKPLDNNPAIPEQVENPRWEGLPGAVKLTYDLPNDPNFLYAKAECVMKNGQVREAKASAYFNRLILEGFADTALYTVNIYSVSRSEVYSEPVVIRDVRPKNPYYLEVFKTLDMFADFGGATVSFFNADSVDLAINIAYIDSTGFWTEGETLYTNRKTGYVSQRGIDTLATVFGVVVRDRWNNVSDTLKQILKPLYEEELDKELFREYTLPGDEPSAWGWTLPMLWDGSTAEGHGFHTENKDTPYKWPQSETIDLGKKYLFSRFKFWNREAEQYFNTRCPNKLEIWGSNQPAADGSWDSWTLLMTVQTEKPSGLPDGDYTEQDLQAGKEGFEFSFPKGISTFRYIRLNIYSPPTNVGQFHMMEITLWGVEVN
ncbi:MAG: DUF4959 domain-containing protein [Bacteroidales bacterium]|jgi:hypothetical protein|nr:DUF4959 domain-containing protein [Bacteroidales bacterium]